MTKVFVLQENLVRDGNGAWSPKFDLTNARRYGELAFIFSFGQSGLVPDAATFAAERLVAEDFEPGEDYVLLTGDMHLGIALSTALQHLFDRPTVRFLRYDKRDDDYHVISQHLFVNEQTLQEFENAAANS